MRTATAIATLVSALLVMGCQHTQTVETPSTLKEAYRDAFLLGTAVNQEITSGKDALSPKKLFCSSSTALRLRT